MSFVQFLKISAEDGRINIVFCSELLKKQNKFQNIRFTARAFRTLLSFYVFSYFPFGCEGRILDLIVSVHDHCLSFQFA